MEGVTIGPVTRSAVFFHDLTQEFKNNIQVIYYNGIKIYANKLNFPIHSNYLKNKQFYSRNVPACYGDLEKNILIIETL